MKFINREGQIFKTTIYVSKIRFLINCCYKFALFAKLFISSILRNNILARFSSKLQKEIKGVLICFKMKLVLIVRQGSSILFSTNTVYPKISYLVLFINFSVFSTMSHIKA